ncbi:hypothetical protein AYO20_10351 [Fonsecaea nubica]|uniref:Chromatin modification-related protein EAF7 n=1 Tax=Fonsecaea nubica TaxID=856822 RepID=A0A178C956_9EURO|nr:hypothetical protein AYO20_10351 [Fonsecaea nubica]OAL25796.1 hypothetical protein AYO20_10351 [Fonsecaea nubica]
MATTTASVTEASTYNSSSDDTLCWTTAQESALLQAIIRWKPVGMHKHFRMIAIRDHLLSSGAINPDDSHTSTAGIWRKLASLYDLEKLDEREDSIIFDGSGVGAAGVEAENGGGGGGGAGDESRSGSSSKDTEYYWREFELPGDDFGEMMWERRLAPEPGSSIESSPLTQPSSPDVESTATRGESTIADTDEPRSSPVSVSGRGSGRGRGRGSGRGRLSRLQNELETAKSERGGSRRTSKAPSVVEPDGDRTMEDAADEDAADEEPDESGAGEEGDSDDHEEEEAEQKRSGPAKRGRGGSRRGRGRKRRR